MVKDSVGVIGGAIVATEIEEMVERGKTQYFHP